MDLLREGLARTLGAALLSEERLEATLRPTLERYGLPPAEIDAALAEARRNVAAWRRETAGDLLSATRTGLAGLLSWLDVPTRSEIAELEARLAAPAGRRAEPPAHGRKPTGSAETGARPRRPRRARSPG